MARAEDQAEGPDSPGLPSIAAKVQASYKYLMRQEVLCGLRNLGSAIPAPLPSTLQKIALEGWLG